MTTSGDTQTSWCAWPRYSRKALQAAGEGLLAVLFPPRCLLCGKPTAHLNALCEDCIHDLPSLTGPRCVKCQAPLSDPSMDLCRSCGTQQRWFDLALSLGPYDSAWGDLTRAFKFDKEQAVKRFLVKQMADYLVDVGLSQDIDIVTYVPMTRRSLRERGFNQAKLLALGVGRLVDRPAERLLRKLRETAPQARLSAQQRQKNLRGAFQPIRSVSGNVLLIDDIFTTGSTVEECAHALKDGGCREVMVLTIARA